VGRDPFWPSLSESRLRETLFVRLDDSQVPDKLRVHASHSIGVIYRTETYIAFSGYGDESAICISGDCGAAISLDTHTHTHTCTTMHASGHVVIAGSNIPTYLPAFLGYFCAFYPNYDASWNNDFPKTTPHFSPDTSNTNSLCLSMVDKAVTCMHTYVSRYLPTSLLWGPEKSLQGKFLRAINPPKRRDHTHIDETLAPSCLVGWLG